MILRTLTVSNYGTFRGEQRVDLSTRPGKPIVLFGGKNGAGKTTLLEALQVCLYGQGAAGERVSREAYSTFLNERIHTSPALLVQPTFASVAVEFAHADVGRLSTYTVTRSWERSAAGRISERLEIARDGQTLTDVSNEQWQDFIRELIPPGVVRLFFFDGERIQHLAEDSTDQRELSLSLKALLGTDIIERLQADLSIYRTRLGRPSRSDASTPEFQRLTETIAGLEQRIHELKVQRDQTEAQVRDAKDAIARVEQRIKAEGGALAKNRDSLIAQRESAKARIHTLESSVRLFCQGVLPFALAPRLCERLKARLISEEIAQHDAAARSVLGKAEDEILARVSSFAWCPPKTRLSSELRASVAAKITAMVREAVQSLRSDSPPALVHQLSSAESRQLLQWIEESQAGAAERMRAAAAELEDEYRALHRAEAELKRIPEDDVLSPHLHELQELNKRYGELSGHAVAQQERIRREEGELATLRRELAEHAEKLGLEATFAQRVRLIAKVQAVLEEFRERLLENKVEDLARSVTACFNELCRKTDAVRRAAIGKDFSVVLFDRDDRPIPKERLSAGEKQVYAIAMLWALARTSGRPLPVIIDTPLGRLDSDHRRLLVERYFPAASHQVILLSTDTEVDQTYFDSLRRHVATAYRLDFDMRDRCTSVERGYFFANGHEAH